MQYVYVKTNIYCIILQSLPPPGSPPSTIGTMKLAHCLLTQKTINDQRTYHHYVTVYFDLQAYKKIYSWNI